MYVIGGVCDIKGQIVSKKVVKVAWEGFEIWGWVLWHAVCILH